MKYGNKIPKLRAEMILTFIHLYDENFGVIAKNDYNQLIMIMPSKKFIPELGKNYHCFVSETRYGKFIHNGRTYKLAIASREDEAGIIDQIDYEYSTKSKFSNNPFNKLSQLK